jgi:hypothetical protein
MHCRFAPWEMAVSRFLPGCPNLERCSSAARRRLPAARVHPSRLPRNPSTAGDGITRKGSKRGIMPLLPLSAVSGRQRWIAIIITPLSRRSASPFRCNGAGVSTGSFAVQSPRRHPAGSLSRTPEARGSTAQTPTAPHRTPSGFCVRVPEPGQNRGRARPSSPLAAVCRGAGPPLYRCAVRPSHRPDNRRPTGDSVRGKQAVSRH